jgi:hypothetical protein
MGEAKRNERMRKLIHDISKSWVDQGRIIEGGFRSPLAIGYHEPEKIPPDQLTEMRRVFFAGAQHLYASMLDIMDPGTEPTEADMRRMTLIDSELRAFLEEQKASLGLDPGPRPTHN